MAEISPLSVNIERVAMIEDLRTCKEQMLVFIRWTTPWATMSEGFAIWGVHEDGSVDCGEWLRKVETMKVETMNPSDHDQADGWL